MFSWEIVFRRPGEPDRVESISADNLIVGDTIEREGTTWVVTRDDGPSERPEHVARLICEPQTETG